jgi:hypothetical protein
MRNRILALQATIETRVKELKWSQAEQDAKSAGLDFDLELFTSLHEAKSLAVIHGKLSQEEGQTVYSLMGEQPSTLNSQSYAAKVTLTKLLDELLGWKQMLTMSSIEEHGQRIPVM